MATEHEPQRIERLTPLATVLARIDELVQPVAPRELHLSAAVGRTLAEDVVVASRPLAPIALRDGWAVVSFLATDASSYAPLPLSMPPQRIDVGEPLAGEADSVAPLEAVLIRGGRAEIIAPVTPGEGVLARGGDSGGNVPAMVAGSRLGHAQHAVLAALKTHKVVVREPRVHVVRIGAAGDPVIGAAAGLVAAGVESHGAIVVPGAVEKESGDGLAWILNDSGADLLIAIGGTGSGRGDASVRTLARLGRVEAHGIAILPGETAAFGVVGRKPVLLVPGRVDAALAIWLTLGRRLLSRLCAGAEESPTTNVVLARKVASPLGFTEIVPVGCRDGKAEPIASGYWPLSAITQADGWIMVPAESEGYPEGAEVVLRRWP